MSRRYTGPSIWFHEKNQVDSFLRNSRTELTGRFSGSWLERAYHVRPYHASVGACVVVCCCCCCCGVLLLLLLLPSPLFVAVVVVVVVVVAAAAAVVIFAERNTPGVYEYVHPASVQILDPREIELV